MVVFKERHVTKPAVTSLHGADQVSWSVVVGQKMSEFVAAMLKKMFTCSVDDIRADTRVSTQSGD